MKVSVALCTYNGEKYIRSQLESICYQSRSVDEIIISDDHSSDQTIPICEEILSKETIPYKIKVNEEPLRVMGNFQQCFSLCSGDIIFSCDQDDLWEKHKVEKILECFTANPEIDMIATNATLIDGKGYVMNLNLRESIGFSLPPEPMKMLPNLLRTFCITGATMAFRKSFEEEYFYKSSFWLHDGWLALMAAMGNHLLYLDDQLTRYRLHGNNVCGIGYEDVLNHGTLKKLKQQKKRTLFKTVLTCPYYYEDLAMEKLQMYREILSFYRNKQNSSGENVELLKACIRFWEERSKIADKSFGSLRKMIKEFSAHHDYEKYSESKNFARYDYYFWFIYRILPRHRK